MPTYPKGLKVSVDKTKKIFESLSKLASTRVMVGIPADKAGRNDDEPINNAEIGYIQENGAPEVNIPARPHLVPGVSGSRDKYIPRLKDAALAAMAGDESLVTKNQHAAGFEAEKAVKTIIDNSIPPPLAESTLYNRKHRKVAPRQGEVPLVDKGLYRRSITHVLRKVP